MMAKLKKIYESVFKKIAGEVSRCQNTTKTKLFEMLLEMSTSLTEWYFGR